jgi:hypothetical protein
VLESRVMRKLFERKHELAMKSVILVDITKHVNKLNVILKLPIPCIFRIKVHRLLHQLNTAKHVGDAH